MCTEDTNHEIFDGLLRKNSLMSSVDIVDYVVCDQNSTCSYYEQKSFMDESKVINPIAIAPAEYYSQRLTGPCIQALLSRELTVPKRSGRCKGCQTSYPRRKQFNHGSEAPILVSINLSRHPKLKTFTMGMLDKRVQLFGVDYVLSSVVYVLNDHHYKARIATRVGDYEGIFLCDSDELGGKFLAERKGRTFQDSEKYPDEAKIHEKPIVGKRKTKNSTAVDPNASSEFALSKTPIVDGYLANTLFYIRSDMMRFTFE
jgi:hypothetical protein